MNDELPDTPAGEFLLSTTEDRQSRVECRFENKTLWLSQGLMGELFGRDVRDPLLLKLISGGLSASPRKS